MAFYGSLGEVNYGALDASITDTAVDIFVYDTSKDSDGGAWRYRTQHTSWYNETLNTATRGSRKEFPAVAVIVAETDKVTIYDGDDPDLPMWMVFNQVSILSAWTGGGYLWFNVNTVNSSVSALNGIITVGTKDAPNNNVCGVLRIMFLTEVGIINSPWNGNTRYTTLPISGRNTLQSYIQRNEGTAIVNSQVNDVAMTVLPNAPIDPATGLPIPTIAVATDNGVSVIKDDGNVWDINPSNTGGSDAFGAADGIYIDSEYVYFGFERLGALNHYIMRIPIPNSDLYPGAGAPYYYSSNWWQGVSENTPINNSDATVSGKLLSRGDIFYIGGTKDDGTVLTPSLAIHERNPINKNSGLTCGITKSYNTGWMHGDIKGAFLSDTDATNITGIELVTNGTFDTDISGWSAYNSTLALSNNQIEVTRTTLYGFATQLITMEVGKTYVLSVDARCNGVGSSSFGIKGSVGNVDYITPTAGTSNTTMTPLSVSFVATQSTGYIHLQTSNTTGAVSYFDNVSLRLAEEDRSVNDNGLQVFGTITKSPVATGADLVGYSGFSQTNYLKQPYNSDLDFGTGDFSFSMWVRSDSGGSNGWVFQLASSGDTTYMHFLPNYNGNQVLWNVNGQYVTDTNLDQYNAGEGWALFNLVRISGTAYVYKNGNLVHSFSANTNLNFSGGGLTIGNRQILTATAWDGDIALFRVSKSAPSAEQIKKIYEDEKVLFQENAACTLYGSSDAVTALAYDDKEELLHVGTSSGRSDFRGLRRINNTETAVTTAISAYDGLIAQQ